MFLGSSFLVHQLSNYKIMQLERNGISCHMQYLPKQHHYQRMNKIEKKLLEPTPLV